jgi:diaminopimelate decarboxylase
MDHFHHRDGEIWCEDVPLAAVAEEVGTPAYVYSAATVREHVRRIREAFAELEPLVCYAAKANENLALLRIAREEGAGFDIVSEGELRRVLAAGAAPETVVFSGVGKTEEEMEAALEAGVLLFNVESEEELEVLASVARRTKTTAGVAIRVNPDVDPRTHKYISTGKKETKFGVAYDKAEALARKAAATPGLELRGIQCHIGSQITTVEPYAGAVARIAQLAVALRKDVPTLRWLDMGGGYGIYYRDPNVPALKDYAEAVAPVLRGLDFQLIVEPGRVIVGNAGVLLTRVLFNKRSGAKRYVIVDAAMNDLIRPSLYGGYHRIWPARGEAPPALGVEPPHERCDVVGPICESGDFLAQDRPLPEVRRGDLLAVMSVGAYGYAMSSNYNERRRPPEVLVDGSRYAIVRRRETYDDLLRLDEPDAPMRTPKRAAGAGARR